MLNFLTGLVSLILGGELIVRYLSALSDSLRVRRAFMGLVIVAFGTSLPEFFVSLIANLKGSPHVAVGNVFGSYMANIGIALGLSCLIKPIKVDKDIAGKDIPMMLISLLVLFVLSVDGSLGRLDAAIALLFFIISLKNIRLKGDEGGERVVNRMTILHVFLVILGFLLLTYGSDLLVQGAKDISKKWRIAEVVIGSTMVAIGTSIPELATTLIAAKKGEFEIALGNIIGSNIFNMLFILGIVSMVKPLPVDGKFINLFFPFMVGLSAITMLRVRRSTELGRLFGILFLAAYSLFFLILT